MAAPGASRNPGGARIYDAAFRPNEKNFQILYLAGFVVPPKLTPYYIKAMPPTSKNRRDAGHLDLPALVRQSGLRVTKPRIALLESLAAASGPVSIEQLHAAVGKGACDLVTVYRCMATFERKGVVARSYFHDGTTLFRLVKGETDRYSYHVLSKSTNQVDPLDPTASAKIKNLVQQIEKQLRDQGYTDVGHIVEFFGTRS